MSSHQSRALLCRYRCRLLLPEIQKGVGRNSELEQRFQLCESGQINDLIDLVLGQQNSGPLRRTATRLQPQTDIQRGKRACALTARGSISKAMNGLVGGAAQGSADCRRNWTAKLGHWNSSYQRGVRRGGANCLGWWKVYSGTERDEGPGVRGSTGVAATASEHWQPGVSSSPASVPENGGKLALKPMMGHSRKYVSKSLIRV